MLEHPDQADQLIRTAIACVVTRDEAQLLNSIDDSVLGWGRYVLADIDVCDMANDAEFVDPSYLAQEYDLLSVLLDHSSDVDSTDIP